MLQGIAFMSDSDLAHLAINQTIAYYDSLQRRGLVQCADLHMRLGLRTTAFPSYDELEQQTVYNHQRKLVDKTHSLALTVADFACDSDTAGRKHGALIRKNSGTYSTSPGGVLIVARADPELTDSQKIGIIGAVAGQHPNWCKLIACSLAGTYAALWQGREARRDFAAQ